MIPTSSALVYLAAHLLGLGVLAVFLQRSTWSSCATPRSAVRFVATLVAAGLGLAFLTAPRAPGGYGFAVMLAWTWTLGLALPAALAIAAIRLIAARHTRWGSVAALIGCATILATVDAFLIEPTSLEVNRHTVVSAKVDAPLRIAVLADIQTDSVGAHERAAFEAVAAADVDLVLIPGDVIQAFDESTYDRAWTDLVRTARAAGLEAPLGVIATPGDVDWPDQLDSRTAQIGWTLLSNPAHSVALRSDVDLTALSLADSATAGHLERPRDTFHIVVGHRPDYALGAVDADLLVAGHTHGGQVQLPWFGPLLTLSHVPRDWAHGRTELEGGRTLIVSRGVGMERGIAPRLRFGCRPEVVLIDVVPAS